MTTKPVIALGDANVDMVIRLPERTADSLPTLTPPALFGGGSVANVSVALARLGVSTAFVGTVGDDGYGRFVQHDLAREGVDTRYLLPVRDAFTTMVIAMIEPNGERLVVAWPTQGGAHIHLRPDDISPQAIENAAWLHTSGMVLRDSPVREAVLHAMELARAAGVPVSLDLNLRLELWGWHDHIRETVTRAIALADVVFGSAAEEIVPLAQSDTVEAAALALTGGQRTVVARLGAEGALAVTPAGDSMRVPSFSTPIVDTLGAGDAFDGGFIAARLAGHDTGEATRWGNAVAALKIARKGARGLPTRTDVERVLASGTVCPT